MKYFSTEGYNFVFKYNPKNSNDVFTDPNPVRPPYDPSSPTQSDDKHETPNDSEITIINDTNTERHDDKTDNVNDDSIEELLVSDEDTLNSNDPTTNNVNDESVEEILVPDDEDILNNDNPTTDGASGLDHNNSNNVPNDTNDSDSNDDDIPLVLLGKKHSPLRYRQNMIHPFKDRNHYPRDPDSDSAKYTFGESSTSHSTQFPL